MLSKRNEEDFVTIFGGESEGFEAVRAKALSVAMPSKPITDPEREYVPSFATDLRETFRKAREAQQQSK